MYFSSSSSSSSSPPFFLPLFVSLLSVNVLGFKMVGNWHAVIFVRAKIVGSDFTQHSVLKGERRGDVLLSWAFSKDQSPERKSMRKE